MRLTCPNCGAEYEVSDGMIPSAGRHVQCTACHTRWFVRGAAGAGLTEDQILRRLETWSPGPRPQPAPVRRAVAPRVTVRCARRGRRARSRSRPHAARRRPPSPRSPGRSAGGVRPARAPGGAGEARDRPPSPGPRRSRPRARRSRCLRLDLGEPAAPPVARAAGRADRFGRGFLLALLLAALALPAYSDRAPIAAQVPPAAPGARRLRRRRRRLARPDRGAARPVPQRRTA